MHSARRFGSRRAATLSVELGLGTSGLRRSLVTEVLASAAETTRATEVVARSASESTALTVYRRSPRALALRRPVSTALTVYREPNNVVARVAATSRAVAVRSPVSTWTLSAVLDGAEIDPIAPSTSALVPLWRGGGGGGGAAGGGGRTRWQFWSQMIRRVLVFGGCAAGALALYASAVDDDPQHQRAGRRYFDGLFSGLLTPTRWWHMSRLPGSLGELPLEELYFLWTMGDQLLADTDHPLIPKRLGPLLLPLEELAVNEARVRGLAHRLVELSVHPDVTALGAPSYDEIQRAIASTGIINWFTVKIGLTSEERVRRRANAAIDRYSGAERDIVAATGLDEQRDALVTEWSAYLTGKVTGTAVISQLAVYSIRRALQVGITWPISGCVILGNILSTVGGFNFDYQLRRQSLKRALTERGFGDQDADNFARLLGLARVDIADLEAKLVDDLVATEAYASRIGRDRRPAQLMVRRGLFVVYKMYQENLPSVVDQRASALVSVSDDDLQRLLLLEH